MRQTRMQTTISAPVSVSGRGYWSGRLNTLTFVPAEDDFGIQFVRSDLPGKPRVPALAENCVSMPLRTRLQRGAAHVDMVEHVMSALYGLGIDNVEIRCTESEIPGFDGSSHQIALALKSAGMLELKTERTTLIIREPMTVGDGDRFVRIDPIGSNGCNELWLCYKLDYGTDSPIGQSEFSIQLPSDLYLSQVAPARTFITSEEAHALRMSGVARHVTERDLIVFGESGPIDNQLRFPDECARHKTLDLIGDLALAGVDLVGRVTACRSGHQMNGKMAQLIRSQLESKGVQHAA